jgi:Mlc titration factor MtfA (ptsG expression regulator)
MPPDTSHIPGESNPLLPIHEMVMDTLTNVNWQFQQTIPEERPRFIIPEWQMFLVAFLIVFVLVIIPWIVHIREVRKKNMQRYKKIEDTTDAQFDHWLNRYNPYYASLGAAAKKRFVHRVQQFMLNKEFRFHSMVEEPYIPVLISGTAVQLTFGLRNFLMEYFDVIHVLRREYVLNIDKETYYGHVSKMGIHISWSHFLEGYNDYTDAVNVGLHEMAHALQYDSALGEEDKHDRSFKERLRDFCDEGRPVFRAMRQGESHVLDDYAANNFDEFWAVSVETFFENPAGFQERLPSLYAEMTHLLNQDPLLPDKVINWELS